MTAGHLTGLHPNHIADHGGPDAPSWAAGVLGPPRLGLLVTELDGDLTIYDPSRDEVHALNASAGDIWRLIDGEHELDDIVEHMAGAYSSPVDEVRPHVVRMVGFFVERDLVQVAGGT